MGRATELFDYLSHKHEPTDTDSDPRYFSLTVTPELKKFRKEFRKSLTKVTKSGLIQEDDGTHSLW